MNRTVMTKFLLPRLCVTLLILCVCISGCTSTSSRGGVSTPEGRTYRSDAQEIEIGRTIHAEVLAQVYPYTEPAVVAYVSAIGQSMLPYVERKFLPYSFTILYDERIYATVAPGGYVYLTTGLINFAENEAELAGAIAHELARIQHRDPRLSGGKRVMDTVKFMSNIAGPFFGSYGALASVGLSGIDAVLYSERSDEAETIAADACALSYMIKSSYDPQGWIDFNYKIFSADIDKKRFLMHYLVSHPVTPKRIEHMNRSFRDLPFSQQSFDVHRARYLEITKPVREIYQ